MLELQTLTPIRLRGDCEETGFCTALEQKIRGTVDRPKYRQGAAIMEMPESLDAWRSEHRTARKRADRSWRLGYSVRRVDFSLHSDDIFEINTSLAERQGRPMSEGYLEHREQGQLPNYPCELHAIRTYGVTSYGGKLVAYMTLYRINELAMISMILGHGEHLRSDIMYLLFAGMIGDQAHLGGWLYYNLWDSGEDGLRYYKEKVGFGPGDVRWDA